LFYKRKAAGIVFLVYLAGLQEAGPEGKDFSSHNHSLHINMRLVVIRGRAPAPTSGHGRPMGAGPPAPAPADHRSPPAQLRPEVSALLLSSWAS